MAKKLWMRFDGDWVLSKKDEAVWPVAVFLNCMKEVFEVEIVNATTTECELVIKNEKLTNEEIMDTVAHLLTQELGIEDMSKVFYRLEDYIMFSDDEQSEEILTPLEEAIEKIDALVGVPEFKSLTDECIKIADRLKAHNVLEAFTHQSYIFAINDGNGLTTYLKRFADLLEALGLFRFAKSYRVVEDKLAPPQSKERNGDPFYSVRSRLSRFGAAGGMIICMDISEWMTNTGDKKFREFLADLEKYTGKHIFVFRVPFVEKEILERIKRTVGDVLCVRDVSFVPFDNDELVQYAKGQLDGRSFTVQEDAWEIFEARLNEEKNDGRFYGMNTVNKVIREMLYQKYLSNAADGIDDAVIKKSEILGLAASYNTQEKSGLEMLDEFVGMETVRDRVEEIVAQIEMSLKDNSLGAPCIHMRFIGNPGTGKTTVARIIGKILKEKGILRNGSFFEYTGRDFCGRYIGETAPKTAAMCRDAYGSVLFIDEAYSLYRERGSGADFGREAIDTLIAEMENHRSDLMVIMAGYPDEMETLMKANAGLESRMPYILEFPNYTRDQLYDIFMLMVNKSFTYKEGFEQAVKDYFVTLPDEVITAKEFSNARFVRNLFERTWGKAVLRSQLNKQDPSLLTKEDFILASSEKEFKKIMQKPNRALGFV